MPGTVAIDTLCPYCTGGGAVDTEVDVVESESRVLVRIYCDTLSGAGSCLLAIRDAMIFRDGFESGGTTHWSLTVPSP